jgi:F-type H+-transporting ATPase subunit delta
MADQQVQSRVPSVLEDPSTRSIARVYANALLRAAGDDAAGVLEEFTSFHDDVLEKQPQFARLLTGRLIGEDDALRLIDRVVGPFASPVFTNFLRVLARHRRLDLLPLILHEAHLAHERATGKRRVEVTSAVPLSDEQRRRVGERLRDSFPFEPILIPKVDPKILGGLIVQVGDTVYDTSVRSRLNQLRGRMRQRSLHEIQRGRDRFRH